MPKRDLELEIRRGSQRQDILDAFADPDDYEALQKILANWLGAKKWGRGKWGDFHMVVRAAGTSKTLAKVRA